MPNFDDLWSFGDPAATEERFREVLADMSDSNPLRLELMTQIARTLGLQRKPDEAHALLDGIESQLGDEPSVARVRYALERGRTLNSSGKPEEACLLFESGWNDAREIGDDGLAVDAAHMLGIATPPGEQADWNQKALELAESSDQPDANRWCGSLLNNMGWSLHEAGNYHGALDLFERALAWRRDKGNDEQTRIARWCVARCLRSLGRVDEALSEQQAMRAEHDAAESPGAYNLEELGECLHALGRAKEAAPYFAAAWEILKDDAWLAEKEPERISRLKGLGGV